MTIVCTAEAEYAPATAEGEFDKSLSAEAEALSITIVLEGELAPATAEGEQSC